MEKMFLHFTFNQILPLFVSAVILCASVIMFHFNKKYTSLLLLFLGSIALGFFIANLDHFLNLWDEQYHALIAKNLIDHPFKPTLYSTPLLDYDFKNWTANHVWLHKQPLYLWQIALSIKLFGINELAVRIPSIILHGITSLLIFRIGKLSHNITVGFYGALFFAVAYYPLELIVDKCPTDHNDIAFLFYVTASLWAWFEYQNSKRGYWLVLIGIFSGCAVLIKWLVGLLVYFVWVIYMGVNCKKNWLRLKYYLPIFISFLISVVIFLPWQLYILNVYPNEAKYEFQLNARHFFQVIEEHGGDFWFHFKAVKYLYGTAFFIPFLLLIGVFLLIRYSKNTYSRVAILSSILITYSFYTIAATKMPSFCIIVSPFVFLAFGVLVDSSIKLIKLKIPYKYFEIIFRIVTIIFISFFLLNFNRVQMNHTFFKPQYNFNRENDIEQMAVIQKIKNILSDDRWVVFNSDIRENGHISVMFYTNYVAYRFVPNKSQIEQIKAQCYKIAVIDTHGLPDYINNDDNIVKIKWQPKIK